MRLVQCCRYGFSRTGSVALAFVLAENSSMTYEEAVHHVTVRRPVLPHVELKDAIYRIYPRTGPLPVCPNVRPVRLTIDSCMAVYCIGKQSPNEWVVNTDAWMCNCSLYVDLL